MKRWSFKQLNVRKKWIELTCLIYKITKDFPKEEIYWLTSQMRRAAISIPSNIAEWNAKSSNKHFQMFIENAQWSLYELETQILVAEQMNFLIHNDSLFELTADIWKMLNWLHSSLTD